jgi:Arc/MetJ-type ribon-helix-helix transcriptional regulator
MFPRSLSQTGEARLPKPSGDGDDSFNGFRRLNDAQLDALAEEITKQIRIRGPFLSLSHFINRALVELTTDDEDHIGRSGALQGAIDNSGLNMVAGRSDSGFANLLPGNNEVRMQADGDRPMADILQSPPNTHTVTFNNHPSDTGPSVWAPPTLSSDANVANTGSMLSDREMLTDPDHRPEQGFRSTGIPGWLTQADVLQVISPVISVRSDTFRIRAYGEVLDSSGKVAAKAWCEAIVQRTPEFLDPSNVPETRPANLNPINAKFGRRFSVVSFRWLNSNEI